ncbi:MAG: hypothetical protein JNM81_14000 [Rhodospirillaceae bacterium]|nr:hypothetical protein [Rhodospirillaceae bacterium]
MPRPLHFFALTLFVGTQVAAADLHPQHAVTTAEQVVAHEMFQGLVVRDDQGRIAPGLAESWSVSADGLTYRFKLRDRLRWADGKRIDATSMIQAITRALDPATAAPFYRLLLPIKNAETFHAGTLVPPAVLGVSAPDAKTVQFDLQAPSHGFLGALTEPIAMLSRDGVDAPVPEGAFIPQPSPDGAQVLYQLIVNLARKPLDQREVRHALGMSIDREAIVARMKLPHSAPAYGVTDINAVDTKDVPRAPYARLTPADRNAVAQALLIDIKRDTDAPLRIVVPQQSMHVIVAEAVAAAWRPLGFAVDVVPVPAAAYEKTILTGDFDVAWQPAWGFTSTNDPSPRQAVFLFSQAAGPWNAGHYKEPDLDQFLANADADMNADFRVGQWRAAERLLSEDQAGWPLFFYSAKVPSAHDVLGNTLKPAIIRQP